MLEISEDVTKDLAHGYIGKLSSPSFSTQKRRRGKPILLLSGTFSVLNPQACSTIGSPLHISRVANFTSDVKARVEQESELSTQGIIFFFASNGVQEFIFLKDSVEDLMSMSDTEQTSQEVSKEQETINYTLPFLLSDCVVSEPQREIMRQQPGNC